MLYKDKYLKIIIIPWKAMWQQIQIRMGHIIIAIQKKKMEKII